MITLRSFQKEDALLLHQRKYGDLSLEQIQNLIFEWNQKQVNGQYFEMFAIVCEEKIIGTISMFQHSKHILSIGPEIFSEYRRNGFAKEAMVLTLEKAREQGYQMVFQQIRIDNMASVALHLSLGFETNGFVYANSKGHQVSIYLKNLI